MLCTTYKNAFVCVCLLLVLHATIAHTRIVSKGAVSINKLRENVGVREDNILSGKYGYKLKEVYLHSLPDDAIHHYTVEHPQQQPSSRKTRDLGNIYYTQGDVVAAFAEMNEQAYPALDRIISGDDAETAYRQDTNADTKDLLEQDGWNVQDIFEGKLADNKVSDQVGVHVLVYTSLNESVTVMCFQGSYANADYYMDAYWWRDWVVNEQANYSAFRWVELGQKKSDIKGWDSLNKKSSNTFWTVILDVFLGITIPKVVSKLHSSTNIPTSELKEIGYFAVAKKIVDATLEGKNLSDTSSIKLTGHSLGGALASLSSMYLKKKHGYAYETIVFGAVGTQCLARKRMSDYMDSTEPHPQITNYVDDYDVIPMFDHSPGRMCSFRTGAEGQALCGKVMGEGVGLFASPSVGKKFKACRFHSHSIYHFYRITKNDSLLFWDGDTFYGCRDIPPVESCPSYEKTTVAMAFIWISFCLLLLIILVLLFCCLPRLIYVKTCAKEKPFIPKAIRRCILCEKQLYFDGKQNRNKVGNTNSVAMSTIALGKD